MGVGAAKAVFAHVSVCGCARTVCKWSVCVNGVGDVWD